MNTNITGFRWFSKICALDESSLNIGRVKESFPALSYCKDSRQWEEHALINLIPTNCSSMMNGCKMFAFIELVVALMYRIRGIPKLTIFLSCVCYVALIVCFEEHANLSTY